MLLLNLSFTIKHNTPNDGSLTLFVYKQPTLVIPATLSQSAVTSSFMQKDESEDVKAIITQHITDTNNPSPVNVMNCNRDSEPNWLPTDHRQQQTGTCYHSD